MIVLCAVVGALLIATGFGLAWLPLGFIVGGCELVAGAYVARYLEARRART